MRAKLSLGDGVEIGLWSVIETNVTVVCVCFITDRPVLQYLFTRRSVQKSTPAVKIKVDTFELEVLSSREIKVPG